MATAATAGVIVPHLKTLADLSPAQIVGVLARAHTLKKHGAAYLSPIGWPPREFINHRRPGPTLRNKSIALLFSKRSTRTRLAAETSATFLGGNAIFLGRDDIQLGVNESLRDSARVIGGMCAGIFARVDDHSEIEVSLMFYLFFLPLDDCSCSGISGISQVLSRARPQRPFLAVASDTSPC